MKELKDIVLKKGDRVCYLYNGIKEYCSITDEYNEVSADKLFVEYKIIKIERPVKYETIYEAPKQILDEEEKEYLEAVCKPFKENIINIDKHQNNKLYAWIDIHLICDEIISFPYFKEGKYYKGMELNKEYTLKELGLFEEYE